MIEGVNKTSGSKNICVLPGDGIGPEVIDQAVRVLNALNIGLNFNYGDIGYSAFKKYGTPLPKNTIDLFSRSDAALFGAVTTPTTIKNYTSPVLGLRQEFQLFANIRPIIKGNIKFTIIRENTEGLYSGIEHEEDNGSKAITERIITRKGSERIIRFAFDYALKHNYNKVTVVHKANVMRKTCGLFREVALGIAEEYRSANIEISEMLVDRCAMEIVRKPQQFGVIVTTNMFGDILSDEASMLVGGLGVAYSGNIGSTHSMFEPVSGSAPDIAGTGTANPIATILAAKFMLEHLGFESSANKLGLAVERSIKENMITPDLGGNLSTSEASDFIIENLK
jgi:isopropylmalate/isohomocitrate dehydrogenase-like protein